MVGRGIGRIHSHRLEIGVGFVPVRDGIVIANIRPVRGIITQTAGLVVVVRVVIHVEKVRPKRAKARFRRISR